MMRDALALGIVALVLLVVWTISFVTAHLVRPTTWNPIRNAVSEYGVLPHKTAPFIWVCWWTIAAVAAFLAGGLGKVAVDLAPSSGTPGQAHAGIIFLGIFGVARILTSLFPTDVSDNAPEDVPKSEKRTPHGILHFVFAIISFGAIPIASLLWAACFGNNSSYSHTHLGSNATVLEVMGYCEVGASVLMFLAPRLIRAYKCFGLFERIFYASHVLWLYTATVLLIQTGAYDDGN